MSYLFPKVEVAKTSENPERDARLAWQILEQKFAPKRQVVYIVLDKNFTNFKLLILAISLKMNRINVPRMKAKDDTDVSVHIFWQYGHRIQ